MKKLIIIAVVAMVILSCSKKEKSQEKNQSQQVSSSYMENDFYFHLPLCRGGEIDLKNFAGKPVFVMFFTENCPYCQRMMPFIEKIHKKFSEKDLKVIAITPSTNFESTNEFAKDFNLSFDIACDGREVAMKYGVRGVPFSYLLTKEHTLYKFWPGYDKSYEQSIEESISKVL